MQINYSIIIPHRASFNLLERALDSIPDRNDIQILIIDNTPFEIDFSLVQSKRRNKFILYFSDLEKGAGHARNIGIKNATGEWLLFLDADDFFTKDAFEHFDKYIHTDYDIIYFSSTSLFSDTLKNANRHKYYAGIVNDYVLGKENAEDILRFTYSSPWSKLIRNKLIKENAIQFDEVPASNDLMFSIKSGYFAKKIYADEFPAYCMTVNSGSLTKRITKKNSRSRYCVYIQQYKFMTAIGKPQYRFELMSVVIDSLQFGIKEFFWYIHTAYKEKVNIFLNFNRRHKLLKIYKALKRSNDDIKLSEIINR